MSWMDQGSFLKKTAPPPIFSDGVLVMNHRPLIKIHYIFRSNPNISILEEAMTSG